VLCVIAISGWGLSRRTVAQTPPRDLVPIMGTVVDESGNPVLAAEVSIEWYPQGRAAAQTDKDGRFELQVPQAAARGRLVRALADGGQLQARYALPWEERSGAPEPIRLQLRPARRVVLQVVDQEGKPVSRARAGVLGDSAHLEAGETDAAGNAVFLVYPDARIEYVYAFADAKGLDYRAYVLPRARRGDANAKEPELPAGPIRLTLDGTQALRVCVLEADARPIVGIGLYPWLLNKPDQPESLNLSYFSERIKATTDQEGYASWDWIPHWQSTPITLWPDSDDHVRQRGNYDPATGSGNLTMKLDRLVPIRGRVTMPDGSPAEGIRITARGEGYQFDGFGGGATTDAEGRYEIKAAPHMVYLLAVSDDRWGSSPHTGFAVLPDQSIEGLDFQLRPATRIYGQVTVGPDRKPVPGQQVQVYQHGQDLHSLTGIELPNPEKSRRWVQPTLVHTAMSDEHGRFELRVGAGKFDIHGPNQSEVEKFEIHDEAEREFNFHAVRPEKGVLAGLIVTGEPPQAVAAAEVIGIYRHPRAGRDLAAVADEKGAFSVERELHRTVLHARSPDGRLAGVVQIEPDDETVTIPLRPLATASGRLIDATTRQPLPEQEIVYGVKVPVGDDNAPWRTSFGGTTTTDDDGRFELRSLILGQKYQISVTIRPSDSPQDISWRTVGDVSSDEANHVDLGDLQLQPAYRPPTLQERIAAAFQVAGMPQERFNGAQRDAALSRQHVLIILATPSDATTEQLMQLRFEDTEVRRAFDPYRILAVDASTDKLAEARPLAASLGEPLAAAVMTPRIFITDAAGSRLARIDVSAWLVDGKLSKDRLLDFLREHRPEPLNAGQLLSEALARAKRENMRVIIQETATWCGPCWLLSRFLDKQRGIWEKDYVWVKMDHRWTDAIEIMREMRQGAEGGIPWLAILDSEGQVLVTSNGPDRSNIGFPSGPSGQAHFRQMLERTAISLSREEINTLVEALDAEP